MRDVNNRTNVGASYFMAYHGILKTSEDFYSALHWARQLSDNMTAVLTEAAGDGRTHEVYPYRSVHGVDPYRSVPPDHIKCQFSPFYCEVLSLAM